MSNLPGTSSASVEQAKRMKLGRKHPSTTEELLAIAAASTVSVTKLPAGAPLNWAPTWLPYLPFRDLDVADVLPGET